MFIERLWARITVAHTADYSAIKRNKVSSKEIL